jgi:hypothetical protein
MNITILVLSHIAAFVFGVVAILIYEGYEEKKKQQKAAIRRRERYLAKKQGVAGQMQNMGNKIGEVFTGSKINRNLDENQ